MTFTELWRRCRAGDASACRKLHFYYYLLPKLEQIFKKFELDPPFVIPVPRPQPDPVPFERRVGEVQFISEMVSDKSFLNLAAAPDIQLDVLNRIQSEFKNWLSQVEKDISSTAAKMPSNEKGISEMT